MNATVADAKSRVTVWVTSHSSWGTLVFVRPRAQRAKVRLSSGWHVVVPLEDVERYEVPA